MHALLLRRLWQMVPTMAGVVLLLFILFNWVGGDPAYILAGKMADADAISGMSYIFISHDLAVVRHMADRLIVMHQGRVVEQGDADAVYRNPQQATTRQLLAAIPGRRAT